MNKIINPLLRIEKSIIIAFLNEYQKLLNIPVHELKQHNIPFEKEIGVGRLTNYFILKTLMLLVNRYAEKTSDGSYQFVVILHPEVQFIRIPLIVGGMHVGEKMPSDIFLSSHTYSNYLDIDPKYHDMFDSKYFGNKPICISEKIAQLFIASDYMSLKDLTADAGLKPNTLRFLLTTHTVKKVAHLVTLADTLLLPNWRYLLPTYVRESMIQKRKNFDCFECSDIGCYFCCHNLIVYDRGFLE